MQKVLWSATRVGSIADLSAIIFTIVGAEPLAHAARETPTSRVAEAWDRSGASGATSRSTIAQAYVFNVFGWLAEAARR